MLSSVLEQIGLSKALRHEIVKCLSPVQEDADAMLAAVNTGSSDVSYEEFVKFVFQKEAAHKAPKYMCTYIIIYIYIVIVMHIST